MWRVTGVPAWPWDNMVPRVCNITVPTGDIVGMDITTL